MSRRFHPCPRLPTSLKAVAAKLGASRSDIHLQKDASEATVKRAPLANYRVVYFATHGLVAGDVKGLGEPSLALTIPNEPSELDDGLLTASEVAQLKLNADWVVLSACNTAAGDKPGAEALSGLARAFFYAGAHALLVSHWAVESNAATRLTTTTFDILQIRPEARPRGGATACHARLYERRHGPAERLSGDLGTVRGGWRGCREVSVPSEPGLAFRFGSFAPEPPRGAGRLCPEFSNTEHNPKHQPLTLRPSRPGEFHPEPLTDPDLTLSRHPARATARRLPPSIEYWVPPVAG